MRDALTSTQTVLVLGGTSAIALAAVEAMARTARLRRVALAARPSDKRDAAEARVSAALSQGSVETLDFDAVDIASHQGVVDAALAGTDIDVAIVAFGVLPADDVSRDPQAAADVVTTNFTGAVSSLVAVANRMRAQGHGTIVVLSSVAGERPRRSNYLYGSTKAGLDAFATGLGDDLVGDGVEVVVVRPGMVRTAMTEGLPDAPLTVDAPAVGDAIAAAIGGGTRTIWVPRTFRPVMAGLRALPRPVFRRLDL